MRKRSAFCRAFFNTTYSKKVSVVTESFGKNEKVSDIAETFRKSALSFSYICDKLNSTERMCYDD